MRTIKPSGEDFFDATGVYDSSLMKNQQEVNAEAIASARHLPYPGTNGNWMTWDASAGAYVDSGEPSRGATGAAGATGPQGPKGDKGDTGATGAAGAAGAKGDKGDKGDPGDPAPTSAVAPAVAAWLDENITVEEGVAIDTSLSVTGAAADAKATGDAIRNVSFAIDASLTVAGAAADSKTVGDKFNESEAEISDLKSALFSVSVKTLSNDTDMTWESGWYTNTGEIHPHVYFQHSNIIETVPGTTIQYTNLRAPSNYEAQIACFKNGVYDNATSQKGDAYTAYNSGTFTVPDGVNGVSFITYKNFVSYPVTITMTVVESKIAKLEEAQGETERDIVSIEARTEEIQNELYAVTNYTLSDGFDVTGKYYDRNGVLQLAGKLSTTGILNVPYGIKSIYYKAYRNVDIPTILFFDASMQIVGTVIATNPPVYGDTMYEGYAEIPSNAVYMESSLNNTIADQIITVTYSKPDNNTKRLELLEADPLYGLKIACTGDSITSAIHSVPYNGYVAQIANAHGMSIDNQAIWGAVFPQNKTSQGEPRGCIYDTIALMDASADIVIISGGINDAEYYATESYWGSITPDYDDTLDTETFCGALEAICKESLQKWSGKPIIFVFEHRMTLDNTTYGAHFNDVEYPLMIEILQKWGIPYVDLYHDMPSLSYNEGYRTAYTTGDGTHPNYDGYAKFYVPRVYSKIKELMGI